mmetsp:Transcript_2037/g.3695  ORF Transcript_2037/g.3695 Transcript_2037/m.3695 type:complete len:305 (-) Transcript_2037:142-1056(-)
MLKFSSIVFYLVILGTSSIEGFTVCNTNTAHRQPKVRSVSTITTRIIDSSPSYGSSYLTINQSPKSDDSGSSDEKQDKSTTKGDAVTDDEDSKVSEAAETAAATDEDETKAIKKEIELLESQLKAKNRELDSIEKMAEQYTKAGYARKVAEMEQIKKTKVAASADKMVTAKASVLQTFLPVVDELKILSDKYKQEDFATKYSALSRDFNGALTDMGVEEYVIAEGDVVNASRATAVREEHSDSVAKGCVIEALASGYELGDNVMRKAQVVASLGAKVEEKKKEEKEKEVEEKAEEILDESKKDA